MPPSLTARVRVTSAVAEPTADEGQSSDVSISASKARAPCKEDLEVRGSFGMPMPSRLSLNEGHPKLAEDLAGELVMTLLLALLSNLSSLLLEKINLGEARSIDSPEDPW